MRTRLLVALAAVSFLHLGCDNSGGAGLDAAGRSARSRGSSTTEQVFARLRR